MENRILAPVCAMANPLDLADARHFLAAEGWMALGSHREALGELDQMSPQHQEHPDVLHLRWQICAKAENWETCLALGQKLCSVAPDKPSSWISHAQSFYRLKRYEEAFATLFPALEKFPEDPLVRYDLACYHCLLGQVDAARKILHEALQIAGDELKQHALSDPDLKPLWKELREKSNRRSSE